jgi:hypothetical protein
VLAHGAHLSRRGPEAGHDWLSLLLLLFLEQFLGYQYQQIVLLIVSQAQITYPESSVQWLQEGLVSLRGHLCGRLTLRALRSQSVQELLDADGQGLHLPFLGQQGHQFASLASLDVKRALARLPDGASRDPGHRVKIVNNLSHEDISFQEIGMSF